ncbi:MAG: PEP-CTERM sorting domain-containing protein [Alteromonadaceae bacterium]
MCFSNVSFASSVVSCETKSNNGTKSFDYGDADEAIYDGKNGKDGEACHKTNRWQQLGITDGEALKGDNGSGNSARGGWTKEQSQNLEDQGDNGVTWRVQNSDNSWSAFGNEPLTAGANVEFQFVVTRSNEGNHQFDQLKAWSDWNGNGTFEESENIIDEKWYKVADSFAAGNTIGNQLGGYNNDTLVRGTDGWDSTRNSGVTQAIITTDTFQIPFKNVVSNTWMRARVICENSLTAYDRDNNIFLATGYYHQGEVEDHKVAINQVPEPTTLLVFGSALIGLVLSRKKTK